MEESSARSYTKICRLLIRELSLIENKEFNFDVTVYTMIRERDVKPAHTLISDSFGVMKSCGLRGEDRGELGRRFKVYCKDESYMITLDLPNHISFQA